jgi:hypothetical protein
MARGGAELWIMSDQPLHAFIERIDERLQGAHHSRQLARRAVGAGEGLAQRAVSHQSTGSVPSDRFDTLSANGAENSVRDPRLEVDPQASGARLIQRTPPRKSALPSSTPLWRSRL